MNISVSDFIVGTCRTLPKANTSIYNKPIHFRDSEESAFHCILCGSCAELFIQPLQPCFGDFDYLAVISECLVFTDEKPFLPYVFPHIAHPMNCLLMEPYHDYPTFVRLRIFGEMIYDWDRKTIQFVNANTREFVDTAFLHENCSDDEEQFSVVGPAARWIFSQKGSQSFDIVFTVWCPQWPNVAKEWPNRPRKYEWPTNAIIHEVGQNGCHVVLAKHPDCRNDIQQYRLSFSVAEVILLQSWTKIQQIVYHMLRFFAKRELIAKECLKKDEVLCTYHIKTLMLWSCEKKSTEWWNSSSVITICCNLLKILEHWLKVTMCRNYFIPQANLFHGHFIRKNVEETISKLMHYCNSYNLSLWFVENYMQPDFLDVLDARCNHDVSSLDYRSKILETMKASRPKSLDLYFSNRFWTAAHLIDEATQEEEIRYVSSNVYRDVFKYSFRLVSGLPDESYVLHAAEYESCYGCYESMLLILHAAYLLGCRKVGYSFEDVFEMIADLLTKSIRIRVRSMHHILTRPLNTDVTEGLLCLIEAQILMENLTETSEYLESQVLSEISKALLIKALECDEYTRNSIVKVPLAYLAALHFATSGYHVAIDLSSRVVINEYCEKEKTDTLNAGCLLYIEDISIIIGFYLIFRKIRDASLHYTKRPFFLDLRLTPEVFAHYLTIASFERIHTVFGDSRPNNNITQTAASPLDAILIAITSRKSLRKLKRRKNVMCVYQRTNPIHNLGTTNERYLPNEDDIIQLLVEYSLGNMTLFYNAIRNDFDIDCSTVDCYRAAFLYQCNKYSEVYQLCEKILNERDLRSDLKELAFANVMILPPLDSYFDRDIQCLLGLHTLVSNRSPSNAVLLKFEECEKLVSENKLLEDIYSENSSLSKVLVRPYSKKCYYFLGRYFLARYLRVRCLIDCDHSVSEVELEFMMLKACLPFEQLIRCFIETKLRQLQKVVHYRPKV